MTPALRAAQQAAGLPTTSFDERLLRRSAQEQALYGVLLSSLAGGGSAPGLAAASNEAGLTEQEGRAALHRLAAVDLVALDVDGELVGVFPLSVQPTRHLVQLDDGRELNAMCAVDALGVPAMLGLPAVVISTDPTTGSAIRITVSDGVLLADPPDTVVLLSREGQGSLASACCRVIDFYADEDTAVSALASAGLTGTVLALTDARTLGVALFGDLTER